MFARVALELPVPTEFTYSVPERLRERLQPGQRVRVPFRTTTRTGYLVALEETTDLATTRDVTGVVDEEPLVPLDLLELARWVSGYYCCSLGEALQAMLPGGVRRRPKVRCVVRTGTGGLQRRAPKAAALLEALDRCARPPTIKRLLEEAAASRAALKTLERAGLARIEERAADEELDAPGAAPREEGPVLEAPQEAALAAVRSDLVPPSFRVHLLLGVTGSGKTEVYLRAIEEVLRTGRQAIVLVPEIALTPQTVRRFRARFARVAVLHSAQTEKARRQAWQRIRRGEADVVVGPRSAVFAPVPRLGLVVVDEEHENSFKQYEPAPRYHARDVAVVRARAAGCPVILGSATPSLESFANARHGRYALHRLPRRAGGFPLPPVEVVDMSGEPGRLFSRRLRLAVADAVDEGGQVILFLNRRGFATVMVCERCHHTLGCPHCSTTLVFHKGRRRTVCHLCGHEARQPRACPACHRGALQYVGCGTERVAEEAAQAWRGIQLVRVDSDSVRGQRLEEALETFRRGDARILVGTQMIAKGHHFPEVTLVGVVNADTALHLPDFRANERTFSLIAQVAGRAGRGDMGGRVIVQTFNPQHYAVASAARHDYEAFAAQEMEERHLLGLPPERRCALLVCSGESEAATRAAARRIADEVAAVAADCGVEVRGPAKAPIERIRGRWRYMLLLLSRSAGALARTCVAARTARIPRTVDLLLDVDPVAVL
ncbi:MAG: replication restart helicase PriA [Planctomycetota bacterium]